MCESLNMTGLYIDPSGSFAFEKQNNWEESRNNDTKWCYSMLLMFTEVFLVSVDSIVLYCNSHHDVPL